MDKSVKSVVRIPALKFIIYVMRQQTAYKIINKDKNEKIAQFD